MTWGPLIDKVSSRLQQMIRHGIFTGTMDETGAIASGQVSLSDIEVYNDVQHIQHFGFSSSLMPGSSVIMSNLGGDAANGLIVGSHDARHRPTGMAGGEVQVYDAFGNSVHLSAGANGLVITAKGQVTIIAQTAVLNVPDVHMTGTVKVDGDVVVAGKSFLQHIHRDSRGGNTTPPL